MSKENRNDIGCCAGLPIPIMSGNPHIFSEDRDGYSHNRLQITVRNEVLDE